MGQDQGNGGQQGRPLWTIGMVTDRPVLGTGGTFVDGKDVEVLFWDGSSEHLTYPKSSYNDQTVAQAAQNIAQRHLSVKSLQGPFIPPDLLTG